MNGGYGCGCGYVDFGFLLGALGEDCNWDWDSIDEAPSLASVVVVVVVLLLDRRVRPDRDFAVVEPAPATLAPVLTSSLFFLVFSFPFELELELEFECECKCESINPSTKAAYTSIPPVGARTPQLVPVSSTKSINREARATRATFPGM